MFINEKTIRGIAEEIGVSKSTVFDMRKRIEGIEICSFCKGKN
ncbi:helix-turn-helix domain-containing protein [Oceanirhabdus sp. W0125-5]|nr:helix-turn-helix domain-containing protein [Oceanirhabdus sp. W0125-5]WBW99493.1 helix-turn-helix domain containing protein [Oceanirhabdus sp. W0125-5]